MTEKELIKKIKELKKIEPRKDWVLFTKNQILPEQKERVSLKEVWGLIFQPRLVLRPALAGVLSVLVLFGIFASVQNSLPGDFLYSVKKISEKTQAVFVSSSEKPSFQLAQVNKRLEDLNSIIETNQVKNLASGLEELKFAKAKAEKEVLGLKNKPAEEAIKAAKKIVSQVQAISKKEEKVLASLNKKQEETVEPAEKTIAELLIYDLETRTLGEEDQNSLAEARELLEQGDYSEALIKIWEISNK